MIYHLNEIKIEVNAYYLQHNIFIKRKKLCLIYLYILKRIITNQSETNQIINKTTY